MKIEISVSNDELAEMKVTQEELVDVIIDQLDEAILPGGRTSTSFSGYNVVVTVIN